jgi:DNA polymerase III delta prime subunit
MNTELSEKPLVLLFSGPPGHGKTEMAKQLADLLSCPFHKVDCRNHANPWEMFGSGTHFTSQSVFVPPFELILAELSLA